MGPQTEALYSKADILLYGGAAGGGKTDLIIGAFLENHKMGIVLRRESTQLDGIVTRTRQLIKDAINYNKQEKLWEWEDGRQLKLAGCKEKDDWGKYAGIARDFFAFDEAAEFLREQVFSLIAWLRSTEESEGQRCRVILASNPPRSDEGVWIVEEFAPWLDDNFPNPAAPGELRWAITVAGITEWVDSPGEYERNGEMYEALSRTFIPARLDDNPYYKNSGYRARIQNLPEPLRSQLLYGDFSTGKEDDEWQVIPSAWIEAAMERWHPRGNEGSQMSAIAADVAQGGADNTVISRRYGGWYDKNVKKPGKETPEAPDVAGLIISHRRDNAPVTVDVGGGYGGGVVTWLKENGVQNVNPFDGSKSSTKKSKDKQFSFSNVRAAAAWAFREALDPSQEGGSIVALPRDNRLKGDLVSLRWKLTARGIQIVEKEVIKKKLGRSPDDGDSVIMCWWIGEKIGRIKSMVNGLAGVVPKVKLGYADLKKRRR